MTKSNLHDHTDPARRAARAPAPKWATFAVTLPIGASVTVDVEPDGALRAAIEAPRDAVTLAGLADVLRAVVNDVDAQRATLAVDAAPGNVVPIRPAPCLACDALEHLSALPHAAAHNPHLALVTAEQCACGGCDPSFKAELAAEIAAH